MANAPGRQRAEQRTFERKAPTTSNANVTRLLEVLEPTHTHRVCSTVNFLCYAKMNWTGGSLHRSKNARKGTIQQQRAYFARARTHLQNASNSPTIPFRPNYLCDNDDLEVNGQMPSLGSGSVRHTGRSTRRRGENLQFNASLICKKPGLANDIQRECKASQKRESKGKTRDCYKN